MVTLLLENLIFRDRNASEAIGIFSIYIYHITANLALRGHLLNKVKANPALRGHILNKVNVEFYHIILHVCCAQSERYLRFDSYLCRVSDICFPL